MRDFVSQAERFQLLTFHISFLVARWTRLRCEGPGLPRHPPIAAAVAAALPALAGRLLLQLAVMPSHSCTNLSYFGLLPIFRRRVVVIGPQGPLATLRPPAARREQPCCPLLHLFDRRPVVSAQTHQPKPKPNFVAISDIAGWAWVAAVAPGTACLFRSARGPALTPPSPASTCSQAAWIRSMDTGETR